MRFKFYLDWKGEFQALQGMFYGWSGMSVKERAHQYGIPYDVAKKSRGTKKENNFLERFIKQGYKIYKKELKQSLSFHKKFWKKNSKKFSKIIERIFGHKIPTYTVRLNLQCGALSDRDGTDISINAFSYLKPNKFIHIDDLLWEMIFSQIFMRIRKENSKKELSDDLVWGVAELTCISIIQIEIDGDTTNWPIGYAELEPRRQKVKDMYRKSKNFYDYLEKAIAYFKDNPLEKGAD